MWKPLTVLPLSLLIAASNCSIGACQSELAEAPTLTAWLKSRVANLNLPRNQDSPNSNAVLQSREDPKWSPARLFAGESQPKPGAPQPAAGRIGPQISRHAVESQPAPQPPGPQIIGAIDLTDEESLKAQSNTAPVDTAAGPAPTSSRRRPMPMPIQSHGPPAVSQLQPAVGWSPQPARSSGTVQAHPEVAIDQAQPGPPAQPLPQTQAQALPQQPTQTQPRHSEIAIRPMVPATPTVVRLQDIHSPPAASQPRTSINVVPMVPALTPDESISLSDDISLADMQSPVVDAPSMFAKVNLKGRFLDQAPAYGADVRSSDSVYDSSVPWAEQVYSWVTPTFAHNPLYFEQVNMERYGYGPHDCVRPLLSYAHFYGSIAILPYKVLASHPYESVYTLGHQRPGSNARYQRRAFLGL